MLCFSSADVIMPLRDYPKLRRLIAENDLQQAGCFLSFLL